MRSVDTNVLVRWVTRDDEAQASIADAIMSEPVYIASTVLVELVWVLAGNAYRLDRPVLADVLRNILATSTVSVTDDAGLRWAVDRFASGADFADKVHLVASRTSDGFSTFDRRIAQQAGFSAPISVETLP